MRGGLLQALEMVMQPNDNIIHEGRQALEEAKSHEGFLSEMMHIIADSSVRVSNRDSAGTSDSCGLYHQRTHSQPLRQKRRQLHPFKLRQGLHEGFSFPNI